MQFENYGNESWHMNCGLIEQMIEKAFFVRPDIVDFCEDEEIGCYVTHAKPFSSFSAAYFTLMTISVTQSYEIQFHRRKNLLTVITIQTTEYSLFDLRMIRITNCGDNNFHTAG